VCLAEFAARRRQKNKIIFHRDMCVGKNTFQAASVEFVRHWRTNYARSRLRSFYREKTSLFPDKLKQLPSGGCFLLSVSKRSFRPAA